MQLMTADNIAREALRFVPYDFAMLRMHMLLQQTRERGSAGARERRGEDQMTEKYP
jgi:hypothetical protein